MHKYFKHLLEIEIYINEFIFAFMQFKFAHEYMSNF